MPFPSVEPMIDAMLLLSVAIVVFVRLGRGEAGSEGGSWMAVAAVEAISGGGGVVSLVMVYFEWIARSLWEDVLDPMGLNKNHPLTASRNIPSPIKVVG